MDDTEFNKQSNETKLALIKKDIDYIKQEIKDVKRLEYVLLGLFITLFVLLISAFLAGVSK